jgi:sigma-B regulation protein RsbU (phosphoserine phosphatase)
VVAVLDPARHAVTICNAGHLPVFMRDAAGVRTVAADLGDLPLGMDAGHVFTSCTIVLPAGGCLVLCTDGVTEAMNEAGACYGFDRLREVLAGPAAAATEVGRRILADVERHTAGADGQDDVCLVCVRREGATAPSAEAEPEPKTA